MGFFSWIDVNGKENITDSDDRVHLLIPKEKQDAVKKFFQNAYINLFDERGIVGGYDGYGRISLVDIYDVVTFLNVCISSEIEFQKVLEIAKEDNPDREARFRGLRNGYQNNSIETIYDMYDFLGSNDKFREYGIHIGCYPEDNARLPYPIKVTLTDDLTYENSNFSMDDNNQGFFKSIIEDLEEYKYDEDKWESKDEWVDSYEGGVKYRAAQDLVEQEKIKKEIIEKYGLNYEVNIEEDKDIDLDDREV